MFTISQYLYAALDCKLSNESNTTRDAEFVKQMKNRMRRVKVKIKNVTTNQNISQISRII